MPKVNDPERTPNDRRSTVKTPTSPEHKQDKKNTEKQKATQPKKKK